MKPLLGALVSCAFLVCTHGDDMLKLIGTVPMPGVTGRFDHFAIDAQGQRLFVAALGNNTLEVIDVFGKKRITSISGLRKPCGAVFLPEKNQLAVSAGGDGVLKVFSGDEYKLIATVPNLEDADNVRLGRNSKGLVYIGYGEGAIAMIDVNTWKKIGDIKLGGHPESFQVEDRGGNLFVNVPAVRQLAVADHEKGRVLATFPMTKFKSNFPMSLDEANNRVFIGCRTPPRLVVLDKEKGHDLTNVEISGDTDDLFYDAKRQWVYISCGEGFLDVVSAPPKGPLKRIAKIPTRSGARTSFFSRELDRLFLAVPDRADDSAEIRMYQPPAL